MKVPAPPFPATPPSSKIRVRPLFGATLLLVCLLAVLAEIGKSRTALPAGFARSSTQPAGTPLSRWVIDTQANPLGNRPTIVALLQASEGRSRLGLPPTLIVRCREKVFEAYINWYDYLGSDDAQVTTRFGTGPIHTTGWTISTDKEATFYPHDVGDLLDAMADSARFVAQVTPYNENPTTAVFETIGLKDAAPQLKAECPQPANPVTRRSTPSGGWSVDSQTQPGRDTAAMDLEDTYVEAMPMPGDSSWVGSRTSRVYFRSDCEAANKIAPADRRYFRTDFRAVDAGYRHSDSPGC
jgi:hypothetical protein